MSDQPDYTFFVSGTPEPAPRPRGRIIQPRGGKPFVSIYVPDSDKKWRKRIVYEASLKIGKAIEGPVRIDIEFLMPRPEGHFGTGRNAGVLKPSAPHWHIVTCDVDNLAKTVFDGLQIAGVVLNDSAICDTRITKRYPRAGEETGAWIRITSLATQPALFQT